MLFSECVYSIIFLFISGRCLVKASFPLSTTECDKTFLTSQLTWFSSPNFPFNYTERLTCRYTFMVDETTSPSKNLCFQFRKFQLKQTTDCRDDLLEFESRGRFCGDGWKDGIRMNNISIFQLFCVPLKDRKKYTIMFKSVDYSSDLGFYGIPYLSDKSEMSMYKGIPCCQMETEIPCLTGNLLCIARTDLCGLKPKCPDSSDISSYHAGCPKDASRTMDMISFEDHAIFSSSNWNVETAYVIPPYDHTTLSPEGYVMKTRGQSSLLQMETILDPPNIDRCLSFWYFAHGLVQNFELHITSNVSERWRLAWMAREDMGYGWKLGEVQLGGFWGDSIKIKFDSNQESGSLSIDDISIMPGICSGEDISCTFELSTCGWILSDSFVMDLNNRYIKTKDHHENTDRLSPTSTPMLTSRPVTSRSPIACLSFDFFMPSCSIRACLLRVSGLKYDGTATELWRTTKGIIMDNYGEDYEWETAWITFETMKFEGNIRLQIEALDQGLFDVVAIDNITFTTGRCPIKKGPEPAMLPFPFQKTSINPCLPSSFKCIKFDTCIDQTMKCNGLIDCPDASDEIDCPKTGGPLKYSEGSLQPSFLVAITVTITIVVVGAVTITFFVVTRKMMMRRRNGRPVLCYQSRHDLPDLPYDLPKPPPYSLHPPPYSPEAPPYTSREQINLKHFNTPPPPFSDLENSI